VCGGEAPSGVQKLLAQYFTFHDKSIVVADTAFPVGNILSIKS